MWELIRELLIMLIDKLIGLIGTKYKNNERKRRRLNNRITRYQKIIKKGDAKNKTK